MNSNLTDPAFTMNSTDLNSTFTEVTSAGTTAAPESSDGPIIGVVVAVLLLTVAACAFLLYRYQCHNKGDYRTTGELAPGEDLNEDLSDQATSEKKEYFI